MARKMSASSTVATSAQVQMLASGKSLPRRTPRKCFRQMEEEGKPSAAPAPCGGQSGSSPEAAAVVP